MRLAGCVAAAVLVSACYAPAAKPGAPCDLALDNCPTGQTCTQTGNGAFCVSMAPNPDIDAATGLADSGPGCFGTGLVNNLCGVTPTSELVISADRTINTAMVGAPNCDMIVAQPGGGSLCLVAATSITIQSTAKVTAHGPNPLVLIAADTFTVAGTLDASSHAGIALTGPGAATTCGANAGANGGGGAGAGGGGAGGSLGSTGGGGGNGNNGGSGATALAPVTPAALQGGCPGGKGGNGGGGGGAGAEGAGGGAIYLIAGKTLAIGGAVNASGAGGGEGGPGSNSSGGAGGGGSGGMIGLDAPSITVSGSVFANGGGGGGGGGDLAQNRGNPGKDSLAATTAAAGGNGGTGGGGDGGNGFAAGMAATRGGNGTNQYCGGGGGGGGAGIIRIYGAPPSGGTFSPQPM